MPAREDLDAYGSGGDPTNIQRQAIEMAPSGTSWWSTAAAAPTSAVNAILGRRLLQRGLRGVVLECSACGGGVVIPRHLAQEVSVDATE